MEEEKLTLEEKRNALSNLVIAEVTLMHQYNIARDAILEKDGYHGVNGTFAINWLFGEIKRIDESNSQLADEIDKEEKDAEKEKK